MQLTVVRQRCDNDCGLAAVATVAAHHGCPVDYRHLADPVILDGDGTDLLTLSQLAERLGFETRGVKTSYDAIANCQLPAIAHVRRPFGAGHFIVLLCWTPTYVIVADPAKGLRRYSRKSFCRQRTGYLLLVQSPAMH